MWTRTGLGVSGGLLLWRPLPRAPGPLSAGQPGPGPGQGQLRRQAGRGAAGSRATSEALAPPPCFAGAAGTANQKAAKRR